MKSKIYEDPIAAEVRKVKEALAAKFDYDVHAMFADIRKREKRYGKRLVSFVRPKKKAAKT